jgi:hypothetical protein
LPPTNTRGTVSDVRHDNVKAAISEVHRDVLDIPTMVCNVLKTREGAGGQDRSVSDTRALFATG